MTPDHAEPVVSLSELEMLHGCLLGGIRAAAAITRGRQNRAAGLDDDGRIWTRHVEGACCEIAFAKAIDRYYGGAAEGATTAPKAAGGDVGRIQVRGRIADYLDQDKRLIIQRRDADEETFVLVVGRLGVYRIVGFITAGEAKQHPEWIQNPGNYGEAWFVPQPALERIRYLYEVRERAVA